jgi:ATP-dependent Clp protease ATP-binding subunit ClpA
MFERFTTGARSVVRDARAQARELGHRQVGTEHLLLALLQPEGGNASTVLHEFGLTSDGVRAEILKVAGASGAISDADAAALHRIGIDIDAVRAKIEESFGPGALEPDGPGHAQARGGPGEEPSHAQVRGGAGVPSTRGGLFRRRRGEPVADRWNPRSKKVLELSLREALRLKQGFIGTEHILLGLIREGQGLAAQIMVAKGIDITALRRAVEVSIRSAA